MSEARTIVKQVPHCILYSDGSLRVDGGRCSFPHVGSPRMNKRDDGTEVMSFGVDLMIPKDTHTQAKDLIKEAIQKLLVEKDDKVAVANWFLKDGDKLADEAAENNEDKEYLRGFFVVRTSDTRRPVARDHRAEVLTPEQADQEFYGGMWANMFIRPWYFSGKGKDGKTYPKRVLANFLSIQKIRDDTPFGNGRVSDEGVFEPVAGSASSSSAFDDDGGI